ncbi:MAG TPA: nuclear transport factor 2 family protein [Actinomycetota bacterium]|nr:nuclear transport factor 2 family protein [Actinomycetota bacterium]HNE88263.1 nuclear transport factor 2 family protein [Actinomycetota bacterium]HNL51037.1 nuclear transport factor 2 family protein [Actinomycetota bacterium]HUM86455.1 nuclear transport factor 2 family protein [Actinomycetota bacterium]
MTEHTPLQRWHEVVRSRNPALLNQVLAEDAVFHSPILFRPQQGRDLVALYLTGALHVIANPSFHYVREVAEGNDAVLEFETEIDGVHVNGVDLITWNEQGLITDFKVMIRPLKAVNVVQQRMAELLEKLT